jgi:hypothetical protein
MQTNGQYLLKSRMIRMNRMLCFTLALIVGLGVPTSICFWKIMQSNKELEVKNITLLNVDGDQLNQLKLPKDVIVDKRDDSIIICDQFNRRVMQWSRQNNSEGHIIIPDISC